MSRNRPRAPGPGERKWRNEGGPYGGGLETSTDTCMFCFGSERAMKMRLHTIIAAGQSVWFASQTERDLILPFHSLVCPEKHVSNACGVDPDTWSEIRDVKKCFRLMLIERQQQCWEVFKAWGYGLKKTTLQGRLQLEEEDDDEEAEEMLIRGILAEHSRRAHMTPMTDTALPPASSQETFSSRSIEEKTTSAPLLLPEPCSTVAHPRLVPVFVEFHVPRTMETWKAELVAGPHYTVDCLAVTESDAEALKATLVAEFKAIESKGEFKSMGSSGQRMFKKVNPKTFLREEIPRPNAPPPYLYVDFGLEEAYLLILDHHDLNKTQIMSLINNSISRFNKPKEFDYGSYLEEYKKLYREFDCFKID